MIAVPDSETKFDIAGTRMTRSRSVTFLSPYKLHTFYSSLLQYPPDGYYFNNCSSNDSRISLTSLLSDSSVRRVSRVADKIGLPIKLMTSLRTLFQHLPRTDFIYTPGMLSFAKRQFITDAEEALSSWMGRQYDSRILHPLIEASLASDYCKKIICWNRATVNSILDTYDATDFADKIVVIPPATPLSKERLKPRKPVFEILFLGSVNIDTPEAFYYKGGHLALEVFERLKMRHEALRLIIRSRVPPKIKKALLEERKIVLIDSLISHERLESIMWNCDLFLLPSLPTPWMSFLDAMNHALPIITTDTHANSEIVGSGICGYVCKTPRELQYVRGTYLIPNREVKRQMDRVWLNDMEETIQEMVRRIDVLIDNETVRIDMGAAGRRNIGKHGQFSVENRNEHLKRALDAIT